VAREAGRDGVELSLPSLEVTSLIAFVMLAVSLKRWLEAVMTLSPATLDIQP
jgi:hypothetical protein